LAKADGPAAPTTPDIPIDEGQAWRDAYFARLRGESTDAPESWSPRARAAHRSGISAAVDVLAAR
jgi:hypothetical protein